MPSHAYQSPYQLHNDTIKEVIENKECNNTNKMTVKILQNRFLTIAFPNCSELFSPEKAQTIQYCDNFLRLNEAKGGGKVKKEIEIFRLIKSLPVKLIFKKNFVIIKFGSSILKFKN